MAYGREGYLDIPLNNANQAFDGADDLLNSCSRWGPLPDDDILGYLFPPYEIILW